MLIFSRFAEFAGSGRILVFCAGSFREFGLLLSLMNISQGLLLLLFFVCNLLRTIWC